MRVSSCARRVANQTLSAHGALLAVVARVAAAGMCLIGLLLTSVAGAGLAAASPQNSGTAATISGSIDGDLAFPAGSWISAGYHFTGGTVGDPVTFANAEISLPVTCTLGGSTVAGSIVVPLSVGPWTPTGTGAVPWVNRSSTNPLPYEGSVQAPNLCNGNMYNSSGATFTADVSSSSSTAISVKFHYTVPAGTSQPNADCDDPTDAYATDSTVCSTSESAAVSITPTLTSDLTQTIAGHIYLCNKGSQTTTEITGGTLSASGAQTLASTPNPLAATDVAAGKYTMTATAPTGYQLVSCDGTAISPSYNTEKVKVPAGGTATGTFYANPTSVPTQTIAGHIYLCNKGSQTTTEITGGTLSASGAQTLASTPNPLAATDVAAGKYTMTATAPTGYQLVSCDGTAISPSYNTEKVKVPAGGTATGTFYVNPTSVPTQTIAGHIYLCNKGSQTTTEITGGTLSASGAQTLASTPNPLAATDVAAGKYTMTATAPTGYQLVSCDGTAISPSYNTEKVKVPAGGTATGTFYAKPTNVPTITLGTSQTNDANSTGYANSETASNAGENVPFRVTVTNTSSRPVTIKSLTDSWPGQAAFSPICATAVVGATLQPAASAICDFTVDGYSPAAGQSLKNTVDITGCLSSHTSSCVTVSSTSVVTTAGSATTHSGSTGPATSTTVLSNSTPTSVAPQVPAASLAFTGAPVHLRLLLEIGLSLLSAGLLVVWMSRPRRRSART